MRYDIIVFGPDHLSPHWRWEVFVPGTGERAARGFADTNDDAWDAAQKARQEIGGGQ